MQLICETLLPPRMSVTIIFWTLSSYILQSIVIVTTAIFISVYLFIARQSRDRMSGLTSCQAVNQQTCQIRLHNAPNFNQLYLRHFWTDLLPVFSIIICSSQATKLSTIGSAPHFWFHLEIPNFKYKICRKWKYNLHFLHNRLGFCNQIFTQNFYIRLAAQSQSQLDAKLERNRPYGNLIGNHNIYPFPTPHLCRMS